MPADRSQLQEDLSFEILKSERIRARVLIAILAGLLAAALIFGFAVPPQWNVIVKLVGEKFPFGAAAIFFGVALLYELMVSLLARRAIERRTRVPEFARYGNALAETSIPTAILMLLVSALGPQIALNSPVPMVYFLFIGLSTLRLTAALSFFTGCVAALEFSGLALYYLRLDAVHEGYFSSPWPMISKAVVMLLAGAVCGFVGAQTRRRIAALLESIGEKHRVVSMFGQYVSPAVVEQLLHQPVDAEGEVRHVTIMFLDIRNFTSFAERTTPKQVVEYLNTLFGAMIPLINEHHGIINKFLGDGFMACFGAPLSDGRDAHNAVRAARDIAAAVERLNASAAIPPTRIGIGLHSGSAVTGSVGSDARKEYTIIGDTVNLASRVEQLTKQYQAVILATESVWQAVQADCAGRRLDSVLVKGRVEPVAIYALE